MKKDNTSVMVSTLCVLIRSTRRHVGLHFQVYIYRVLRSADAAPCPCGLPGRFLAHVL